MEFKWLQQLKNLLLSHEKRDKFMHTLDNPQNIKYQMELYRKMRKMHIRNIPE